MNFAKLRFLLGGVAMSLIAFLVYHFMFYTKWQDEAKKLDTELTKIEQELNIARQAKRDLPLLEEKIRVLEYQWKLAQRLLPEQEEVDEVIRLITQRATENKIDVRKKTRGSPTSVPVGGTARSPQKGKAQTPAQTLYIQEIPYDLEVEGYFHDFTRFLADLSTLSRLVTTWDTRIKSKLTETGTISANVRAKVYAFSTQAPSPATPGKRR